MHLEAEPVDAVQRLLLAADAEVEPCGWTDTGFPHKVTGFSIDRTQVFLMFAASGLVLYRGRAARMLSLGCNGAVLVRTARAILFIMKQGCSCIRQI